MIIAEDIEHLELAFGELALHDYDQELADVDEIDPEPHRSGWGSVGTQRSQMFSPSCR